MASATDLLRLLEPAVRPAGVPAGRATAPPPAPAGQSFEAMLAERAASPPPATDPGPTPPSGTPLANTLPDAGSEPVPVRPLDALAGIDRVENPALRALLARPAA